MTIHVKPIALSPCRGTLGVMLFVRVPSGDTVGVIGLSYCVGKYILKSKQVWQILLIDEKCLVSSKLLLPYTYFIILTYSLPFKYQSIHLYVLYYTN